jgi:hypothetical protein
MNATEIMRQIEALPVQEQEELFVLLTQKVLGARQTGAQPWVGQRLSFDQACDVVFRENRQLLSELAK